MGPDSDLSHWEILDEQELYVAEPWIRLSRHRVRLPNGGIVDDYHRIQLPEYVVFIPFTEDGRVVMIRQYKHGPESVNLYVPGGLVDKDEEPLDAAKRELLEEVGYVSDEWHALGAFVPNSNYGCGRAHLFMARSARQVAEPDSGDLEEMQVVLMSIDAIARAIREGEVCSLSTVAAVALASNPMFLGFS